ncbi:MAG: GNAT family N-acetyltransferase [Tepidisphaeraceae bacterium]
MPELQFYRKLDVPRDIALQIASAVRFIWPNFFGKTPPLWESTPYPNDCLHFVLTEGDILISHAIVSARTLAHSGETFNVYGLSSVFCYPSHRGGGFGEQVVAAATDYIRKQPDADLALLFCGERVKSLYLRQRWQHLPDLQIHFGDDKPFNDGHVLTLFVSDRARAHDFTNQPFYVGANTW